MTTTTATETQLTVADKLRQWLSDNANPQTEVTNGQLMKALSASPRAINLALTKLEESGEIERLYSACNPRTGVSGRTILYIDNAAGSDTGTNER